MIVWHRIPKPLCLGGSSVRRHVVHHRSAITLSANGEKSGRKVFPIERIPAGRHRSHWLRKTFGICGSCRM